MWKRQGRGTRRKRKERRKRDKEGNCEREIEQKKERIKRAGKVRLVSPQESGREARKDRAYSEKEDGEMAPVPRKTTKNKT